MIRFTDEKTKNISYCLLGEIVFLNFHIICDLLFSYYQYSIYTNHINIELPLIIVAQPNVQSFHDGFGQMVKIYTKTTCFQHKYEGKMPETK